MKECKLKVDEYDAFETPGSHQEYSENGYSKFAKGSFTYRHVYLRCLIKCQIAW